MTANRVLAALQVRPTTEALVTSDGTVTAGELLRRSDAIARELATEPGTAVALELDNGAAWVAGALGMLRAGRACVPIPQFFSAEQRAHAARAADLQTWLSASPQAPLAADGPGWAGRPLEGGLWCWTRRSEPSGAAALPPRTHLITFTSGTTGRPKGVCLAQETLESVAGSLAALAGELGLCRHLCALPLSLLLEHVAGIYAPLLAGMQSVVLPLAQLGWHGSSALDLRRLLTALLQWQPDSVILVPELLHGLVCALEQGAPRSASLRFVAVGGGRVSPNLLERAAAVGLPVYEGYGLSECASVVALNRPGRVRPGCVGEPLPHARLELAADGEVIVHGPCMEGYLGEPPLAAPGRWATGDIGRLEGGFLELRGRKRNVFITSHGRNVSPEWVESELTQTASIAQAAVFGEARPRNLAVLVARQPSQAHAKLLAEIEAAVRQVNAGLPDYARVGAWVLSEQPFSAANGLTTDNGRIRRDAIEAHHAAALHALASAEHPRGESACLSMTD